MSVMGAIIMYIMSMISLFILRKKEPKLERPFIAPFYPVFPAIALLISTITLITMIYFYFKLSLIFFAGLAIAAAIFVLMGKHKLKLVEEFMISPIIE
jgi:ethanolamine permease